MKRFICIILIALTCFSLFADNLQKKYLTSDDIWISANRLCISTGHLGPAPVSPTTGAEIKQALERLDYSSLTLQQKAEYDAIMDELINSSVELAFESRYITLDPEVTVSLEGYAFNNLKNTGVDEFFIPYRDRRPFLYAGVDALFGDFAHLQFSYMFKDGPQGFYVDENGKLKSGYNGNNESYFYNFSNVGFLFSPAMDGSIQYFGDGHNLYRVVTYQPFEAGGSFGNEFFNFYLGRTRQGFGNGISGNLVIGDNFSYQEVAKLSFFSDIFSYYLSLTHFDNVEENEDFRFSGLHQNRLIHRFDFNFFNKFRFAVNVGAHMLSDTPFDLRMLNPMMIAHNWNNNSENPEWSERNGDEINNIFGIEAEYVFLPGYMLSAQFVLDQTKIYGEDNTTVPSAMGFLVNIIHLDTLKSGYLETYIEGAYTSPYLYLNYKEYTDINDENGNPLENYMLDHIVGYRYDQNKYAEIGYSGYIYGPDAFVFTTGAEYSSFSNWSVNGSILYMLHGDNGKEEPFRNMSNRKNTGNNTMEHTLSLTAGASWNILDNLTFYASANATWKWNYMNQDGGFKDFYQAAVGLSWTII